MPFLTYWSSFHCNARLAREPIAVCSKHENSKLVDLLLWKRSGLTILSRTVSDLWHERYSSCADLTIPISWIWMVWSPPKYHAVYTLYVNTWSMILQDYLLLQRSYSLNHRFVYSPLLVCFTQRLVEVHNEKKLWSFLLCFVGEVLYATTTVWSWALPLTRHHS